MTCCRCFLFLGNVTVYHYFRFWFGPSRFFVRRNLHLRTNLFVTNFFWSSSTSIWCCTKTFCWINVASKTSCCAQILSSFGKKGTIQFFQTFEWKTTIFHFFRNLWYNLPFPEKPNSGRFQIQFMKILYIYRVYI